VSIRSERTSAAAGCPEAPTFLPEGASVAVVRTSRGWSVVGPDGAEPVASLVEGLSLADLLTEALGSQPEPDRAARRSARGPAAAVDAAADPRDARIAALERTVAQLEHALAARVSTERAIGVLAERQRISPRAAFEELRQSARSQARPVHELAREVLDCLTDAPLPAGDAVVHGLPDRCRSDKPPAAVPGFVVPGGNGSPPGRPRAAFTRRVEHTRSRSGAAPGDGRS